MSVVTHDKSQKLTQEARKEAADNYIRAVVALAEQVKNWVTALPDWTVTQQGKLERPPQTGGGFLVPITTIDTPKGRLILEPQGFSFGRRAVVEFFAYPSAYSVRLLNELKDTAEWRVLTNSGIYLREEWNRDNFLRLAHDLLHADWQ